MSPWFVVSVMVDMATRYLRRSHELANGSKPHSFSAAGWLDPERMAPDRGAGDRAGDAIGLAGGDLEQREALEQAHVAHGLAVEPGLRRDGVDEVGFRQPGSAAA